jgi:hypothetical protein
MRVVCSPAAVPPAANGLHRELGGVVVCADVDPSGVVGDVVDPVGDCHRLVVGGERVAVHPDRVFGRSPGATGPVAITEPFLGLGVDADHRLGVVEEGGGGGIQVGELGIAVRMADALRRLRGSLQAVVQGVQQVPDGRSADRVALHGKGRGQGP